MPVVGLIRRGAYVDSVALMLVQREVRAAPGVEEAGCVMATDANKALLRDAGLDFPDLAAAGPDDLVVAVRAATEDAARAAVALAQDALARRRAPAAAGYRPRTIAAAARLLPEATLALVSVPGRFAKAVAQEALDAGLHVLLFSDNVPLEDEVALKARAKARGLLCMGPDCGTAIIGGAALGFANRVRRGSIGLVGAAGTGLQEVTSLIHRFGGGITHAIGTGGRDLSAAVGGATMLQGLRALALDPATEVIVLVGKPPAPEVAAALLAAARACGKPVVVCFVGAPVEAGGGVESAVTLEEAARLAVRRATGADPGTPRLRALPAHEAGRLRPQQRYVRGLYAGGTLCYEALVLLRGHLGRVWSNTPLVPDEQLDPPTRSREHTVVDMGADEFTQGRLHPMLDPTLRLQRLQQEGADPETAIVLFDVVLGYGAHPDPAGTLVPVVQELRARAPGRYVSLVTTVCGTDEDPQNAAGQRAALVEAGVLVEDSNARAARLAGLIAEARGSRGEALARAPIRAAPAPPPWPNVDAARRLLQTPPAVITAGLEVFAENLQQQQVPVVAVDWQPPAGGKKHLLDLLDRLEA
ncbi:MAG: acyl-CoA synthetase FdrA [Armatimonadota bacterium]|nr:acyl-CoA synthetase FdrA [Armatimonadota bacterium]MDR7485733.1 acyl-CoA synthetase FdrA [Armatimonadota bacterium]MDR7534150.1 acyl-CoA synthetase FdrA [Armatimonadota bacterium]MDR7536397.1 acyl-CoA synthetase FdrA [Armatimonadota bacterium]